MPLPTFRCSKCHAENPWSYNFCGNCGQDSRSTKKAVEDALAKYRQQVLTPTQQTQGFQNPPSRPQPSAAVSNPSAVEPFRWKEALLTGACFVAAFVIFSVGMSNVRDTASVFLVLVVSAGLGFSAFLALIVTAFWTKVDSLDPLLKLVAYVPVVAGGIASFVVVAVAYIVIWVAIDATKSHFADMERKSRYPDSYWEYEELKRKGKI